MSDRKVDIAKRYARLARKLGKYPSRAELKKHEEISRDMIRDHFGDTDALKSAALEAHPEAFANIIDPENFTLGVHRELVAKCKGYKRFVVTTAVAGAPVHDGLMASIKKFCELKGALLLVIPANYALQEIDPDLVTDPAVNIVFRTLKLNSNISVNPIKIDPKQVDPALGLDAFGQTEGTVIIGSPKQRRVPVANSNTKLARLIQATGAITRPRYIPRDGLPKRRDTLAHKHHRMGGVIVEIVDNKLYHFRHFEMCRDGSFNDLFTNYSEDGAKFVGCAAIIQGDKHVGDTDPKVNKAVDEMCEMGKPKYRVEHDFFNGKSISHHSMQNQVERAVLAATNKISLAHELEITADELRRVRELKTAQTHVIVESNHNDWIMQYLNHGRFDDANRLVATKLQVLAIEGHHPLKAAMEKLYGVTPGKDIRWLDIDEDFRIAGCVLGAHGHLGANGRRNPGVKGIYKAYGKAIVGHGHHSEIYHDAMMVGTSTFLKVGYNVGASSWDNSQGILYEDGTRQIVNVIGGAWRLQD